MSEDLLVRSARELGDNFKYLESVPEDAYDYMLAHTDILNQLVKNLKYKASVWDITEDDEDLEDFIKQGINIACIQSENIKKWNAEQV